MAQELTVGIQQARQTLRELIDAALERGEHAVITRNGRRVAVLVPVAWYDQARERPAATNEPDT